ncbi:MAG: ceramidase domain-containing protein [Pseudomonadota bacterium]
MDWTAQIDIYCERLDPSYWAEPFNAITNGAFVLAALWGAYEAQRRGLRNRAVWILIGLGFAIGIGSFLFHTHATQWASLADVLPIVLFVIGYAVTALALIGDASSGWVAIYTLGVLIFLGATGYLVALAGISINGSEAYLPALFLMIAISTVTYLRAHRAFQWFAGATVAFVISLSFRSIDMAVCDAFPIGTHIFWHSLNGLVIALLLQALIRNTPIRA